MIRSEMRDMLRARLQQTTPQVAPFAWTDIALNRYLNLGLREVQRKLLAWQPDSFRVEETANLTTEDLYEWPAGFWKQHEVAISADGVNYTALDRITLSEARSGRAGWVPWSATHFLVSPKPTAAVTNGLRVVATEGLSMAGDTDVCPLPDSAHLWAVLEAQKIALPDVGETSNRELLGDIAKQERDHLAQYTLADEPASIQPVVSRYE